MIANARRLISPARCCGGDSCAADGPPWRPRWPVAPLLDAEDHDRGRDWTTLRFQTQSAPFLRGQIAVWRLGERRRLPTAVGPTGRPDLFTMLQSRQLATIEPESSTYSEFRFRCSQLQASRAWPRRRTCRPARSPPRRLNYFQSFPPCSRVHTGIPVLYPLLATGWSTTTAPHQLLSCMCLVDSRQGSIDCPCRAYPTVCPGPQPSKLVLNMIIVVSRQRKRHNQHARADTHRHVAAVQRHALTLPGTWTYGRSAFTQTCWIPQ